MSKMWVRASGGIAAVSQIPLIRAEMPPRPTAEHALMCGPLVVETEKVMSGAGGPMPVRTGTINGTVYNGMKVVMSAGNDASGQAAHNVL